MSDFGIHLFVMVQIIFDGTYRVTSVQISNRANGGNPREELNEVVQLTFSDGYTTEVAWVREQDTSLSTHMSILSLQGCI